MPSEPDRRRSLLIAALGFVMLSAPTPTPRALAALHCRLDCWSGIGLIAVGMARQDYDRSLTRYD